MDIPPTMIAGIASVALSVGGSWAAASRTVAKLEERIKSMSRQLDSCERVKDRLHETEKTLERLQEAVAGLRAEELLGTKIDEIKRDLMREIIALRETLKGLE